MQELFQGPIHLSIAVQIEYLLIVIPLPADFSDINDPPGEFHPPLLTHISRHFRCGHGMSHSVSSCTVRISDTWSGNEI
jgi:hypothetical protein